MKSPLWMPEGSVRSILALTAFVTISIMALQGIIEGKDYLVLVTMIAAFYFGQRVQQPPTGGQ